MQLIPLNTDKEVFVPGDFNHEEQIWLRAKETRIRNILNRAVIAIGKELIEARTWFEAHHKRGFESWATQCFGYGRRSIYNYMRVAEALGDTQDASLLDAPLRAQLQLVSAPDPEAAMEEAATRAHLEGGRLTEHMAQEIKTAQEAQLLAESEARDASARMGALQGRIQYLENQLAVARRVEEESDDETAVDVEARIEMLTQQLEEQHLLAQQFERDARRAREELTQRPVKIEEKEVVSPELNAKLKEAEKARKELQQQLALKEEELTELSERLDQQSNDEYEREERLRLRAALELEQICATFRTWAQRAKTLAQGREAYGQHELSLVHEALVLTRAFAEQLEQMEVDAEVDEARTVESLPASLR